MIKKRYLTLIEIMIVIALIALSSSIIGFKAYEKIKSFSIEKERKSFLEKIYFSNRLSSISGSDIYLFIEDNKNYTTVYSSYEKDFEKAKKKYLNKEKYKNIKISLIEMNNFEEKKFSLLFTATGNFFPKNKLLIKYLKNKKEQKLLVDLEKIFLKENK